LAPLRPLVGGEGPGRAVSLQPTDLIRGDREGEVGTTVVAGRGLPPPHPDPLPPKGRRGKDSDRPQAPPMPAEVAASRDGGELVWVFAYGSLLWDAQVCDAAAEPALLRGYHRSFCLYSYDYRGTPASPGLTLGLDRGGSCRGAALGLPVDALDRVWEREMSGRPVYGARLLPVRTAKGVRCALAFTALRNCPDYAGRLPLDAAARRILAGAGRRGTCRDYFENTLLHLEQLGLADRQLRRLAERVRALAESAGI
jgi:glutathione-specific gamma-glutamylcyclotransferase